MAPGAIRPSVNESVGATMAHCSLQGVCIPLLFDFLSSRRERSKWLKTYVICVHFLTLVQTALQIEQAFHVISNRTPRAPLVLLYPFLTVVLGALVQTFFMFRCWCFFGRHWMPAIPFLLLHAATIVSGIIMSIYSMESLNANTSHQANLAFSIWIICAFLLDLGMSTTTIAYIYRSRTGHQEHEHVLSTIWQVVWASALPPSILMIAVIVEGHIGTGLANPGAIFLSDMTGKLFVLSLMITLVGRGHVRRKLDQVSKHVEASNSRAHNTTILSLPVFAIPDTGSNNLEMTSRFSSEFPSTLSGDISTHHDQNSVMDKC